jgi:RNA polymerase sigma-70 factor (ECF subfamily)
VIPTQRSDDALLGGDAGAFAAFYRRHEDPILRYFLTRTGDGELAADLTAETFAAAFTGRATFDTERGEARGWLFGIARHLLARSLDRGRVEDEARRRLGMEPLELSDADLARIDELGSTPASDALAELPHEQRAAVDGRVLGHLPYPDLASTLRCSESVVRQRVSRGLRTLRTRLEGDR